MSKRPDKKAQNQEESILEELGRRRRAVPCPDPTMPDSMRAFLQEEVARQYRLSQERDFAEGVWPRWIPDFFRIFSWRLVAAVSVVVILFVGGGLWWKIHRTQRLSHMEIASQRGSPAHFPSNRTRVKAIPPHTLRPSHSVSSAPPIATQTPSLFALRKASPVSGAKGQTASRSAPPPVLPPKAFAERPTPLTAKAPRPLLTPSFQPLEAKRLERPSRKRPIFESASRKQPTASKPTGKGPSILIPLVVETVSMTEGPGALGGMETTARFRSPQENLVGTYRSGKENVGDSLTAPSPRFPNAFSLVFQKGEWRLRDEFGRNWPVEFVWEQTGQKQGRKSTTNQVVLRFRVPRSASGIQIWGEVLGPAFPQKQFQERKLPTGKGAPRFREIATAIRTGWIRLHWQSPSGRRWLLRLRPKPSSSHPTRPSSTKPEILPHSMKSSP